MKGLSRVFALALGSMASASLAQPAPSSSGTGWFVNDQGWALTNAHVLEGCTSASVSGLGDATQWIVDKHNDLAVVKVAGGAGKPFLRLTGSAPRLGADIAAFGFPLSGFLSDSIKVTTGNINSLAGAENDTRYLQISTPLQPGNSGGPIVDKAGLVVGVATAILARLSDTSGVTPQNVNFAIRSSIVEMFLGSHGIEYETRPTNDVNLSTVDVVDLVTPATFQILCSQDEKKIESSNVISGSEVSPAQFEALSNSEPSGSTEVATAFAYTYHNALSAPNGEALAFLEKVYTGDIEFYGRVIPSLIVMQAKRAFSERWPVRDYSIRDGSMNVECADANCKVSALVDWFAHSDTRNKTSSGVAKLELLLETNNLVILQESGTVLHGEPASPSGMISRWNDQNRKCQSGYPDSPQAFEACNAREDTYQSLVTAGLCYGRKGDQMEWRVC